MKNRVHADMINFPHAQVFFHGFPNRLNCTPSPAFRMSIRLRKLRN